MHLEDSEFNLVLSFYYFSKNDFVLKRFTLLFTDKFNPDSN